VAASNRLFEVAPDVPATRKLEPEKLEKLIFPVGFYRQKSKQILDIAHRLQAKGDRVPATREELLGLPGVGRKTANLVLNLAFGVEAICVDTHVHRIPNRLGWISTKTPEESEMELEALWPRKHWIEANALLVSFGQQTCTPVSPHCAGCPLSHGCERRGVVKSRP
jgi:endonuclease-3